MAVVEFFQVVDGLLRGILKMFEERVAFTVVDVLRLLPSHSPHDVFNIFHRVGLINWGDSVLRIPTVTHQVCYG